MVAWGYYSSACWIRSQIKRNIQYHSNTNDKNKCHSIIRSSLLYSGNMQSIRRVINNFRTLIIQKSMDFFRGVTLYNFPQRASTLELERMNSNEWCCPLARTHSSSCSPGLKAVKGPCSWAEVACWAAPESRAKPVKAFQCEPVFSAHVNVKVPRWFSRHGLCRHAVAAPCHWRLRSSGRSSQRELAHVFWQVKLNKMK